MTDKEDQQPDPDAPSAQAPGSMTRASAAAVRPHALGFHTLLGRYLWVAGLMLTALIGAALFGQRDVTRVSTRNTTHLHEHQARSQHIQNLSGDLWHASNAVQSFLLDPNESARREIVSLLERLVANAAQLEGREEHNAKEREIVASLTARLRELRAGTRLLLALRSDRARLYPAMPIVVRELAARNSGFIGAATVAIDAADPRTADERETLALFHDTRYAWSQMTSSFRMFVAGRSGVFDRPPEESMPPQQADIALYSERISRNLERLDALAHAGALNLIQEDALERLGPLLAEWQQHYGRVANIYLSENWRTDSPYFRRTVQPLFVAAWERLQALARETNNEITGDIRASADVAARLSDFMWLLAVLGLAFAIAGVVFFESQIRLPLSRLARALKAEAEGGEAAALPAASAAETAGLVAAFAHMRAQVHTREERLRAILDNTAEGIVTFDERGYIESWNRAAERLFGWNADEVLGTSVALLIAPESRENRDGYIEHFVRAELARLIGHEGEAVGMHRDGSRFPLAIKVSRMELTGRSHYTALVANISERKAMLERLRRLAEHDGLTGLYNRTYFQGELERLVERARRNERLSCALLYLDLDNFKYVNDTWGHAAGDKLLIEVAQALSRRARKSDLVVRLGGDEFVILAYDVEPGSAGPFAEGFRRQLADYEFRYEGRSVTIGCSVGVAMLDQHAGSPAQALSRADLACHLAKRAGRNRVHVFREQDESNVSLMSLDMGWSRRIREAIEHDRFVLACQPVVGTRTRALHVEEVLLRLREEDGTIIPPSGFLPTVERLGLSAEVDQWVIANAIALLARELRTQPGLRLSVNLSAQSLTLPALAELITRELAAARVPASALTFEVTETAAIADMAVAVEFLGALRAAGCRTALDDFGSGMASFAYLRDLPVDYVKIDGRFVKNLLASPVDQAMVKAMNDIAHTLGKQTVGEFVESERHLRLLAELGVDYGQGYYLGRPRIVFPHPEAARA
jgi:diguanylate cyclase (GGDEF)-like protein/PAS domain S-box-containing protein